MWCTIYQVISGIKSSNEILLYDMNIINITCIDIIIYKSIFNFCNSALLLPGYSFTSTKYKVHLQGWPYKGILSLLGLLLTFYRKMFDCFIKNNRRWNEANNLLFAHFWNKESKNMTYFIPLHCFSLVWSQIYIKLWYTPENFISGSLII